jgi:DNA repair protein RadC
MVKEASVSYAARRIKRPEDAADLVRDFLEDADREHFLVVCVNTKHEPTAIHTVSVGTLNRTQVHPREIFKTAILANSCGIILAHNHPSGDPDPSSEDKTLTESIAKAGEILGIKVLDHIVVGSQGRFTSFLREHLMPL